MEMSYNNFIGKRKKTPKNYATIYATFFLIA
jgi:hypothetical protein